MRIGLTILTVLVAVAPMAALAQDASTTRPAASAASEWTLPQQDDIYRLLPAGDVIYYLCADKAQETAAPGGPPMRKSYSTIMAFDTKTSSVSNVLLTIPGKFDPDKLKVFGFELSADGKYALMNVNSPSGSTLGGQYIVDLDRRKARKFLLASDTQMVFWWGKELVMPVKDTLGKAAPPPKFDPNTGKTTIHAGGTETRLLQPALYGRTGAKVGTLPLNGIAWAGDQGGQTLVVTANPNALKTPLTSEDLMKNGKILVVNRTGKIVSTVPVEAGRGYAVVYSPNLKFLATQVCNRVDAKPVPGRRSMPVDMAVFSMDGKVNIELPGVMQMVWLSDTGESLSIVYPSGPGQGNTLVYWDNKGAKVWSAPNAVTAGVFAGKAYYIDSDKPNVIKAKALVEEKK